MQWAPSRDLNTNYVNQFARPLMFHLPRACTWKSSLSDFPVCPYPDSYFSKKVWAMPKCVGAATICIWASPDTF